MRRAIPAVLILAAVAALVLLFAPRSVDGPGPRGTADSVPVVAPPRNSVEPAAPRRRSGVLVLDAGGAPVDGAAVELSPLPVPGAGEPAPVPIGTADASGRVPWPERDLDFPVLVRAHHAKRGGGETLARRGDSDCVIRLLPPLTLRGVVVATDDSAVPGAEVEARFEPAARALGSTVGVSGAWLVRAVSSDDGTFALAGMPPAESALLTARKPGWMEGQCSWRAGSGDPTRIVMHRPFGALVRVRTEDGAPVEGAAVVVTGGARVAWSSGIVVRAVLALHPSTPGEYTRDDLAPGWYRLLVAKRGFEIELLPAAPLHPERGPVEILLRATDGVEGTVVDSVTGSPIAAANISAVPFVARARPGSEWDDAALAAGAADELGAKSGPDGSFRLLVAGPESPVAISAVAAGYRTRGGRMSEFLRGDRLRIPLERCTAITLSGRAVDLEGRPVEGAIARWAGGGASTGVDGRFHAEQVAPGAVAVFAEGFQHETVRVEEDGDPGDVTLHPLRLLVGTVVDGRGAPVPGVRVVATIDGAGAATGARAGAPAVSGDAGGVTLPVPAGRDVVVSLEDPLLAGRTPIPAGGDGRFRLVVSPVPGPGFGGIRGRLRLPEGGAPEDGGWIVAIAEDAEAGTPSPVAEADPGGEFAIPRLRAGRWTLKASTRDGYRGEVPGVDVPPGGVRDVVMLLERSPPPAGQSALAEADLRPQPQPAGEEIHRLRAWATSWKSSRSVAARPAKDGSFRAAMPADEAFTAWMYDVEGGMAGVAGADAPVPEPPLDVALVPAGWIVLEPDPAMLDRWVVLRDARETAVYSGFEAALPLVKGEGYRFPVPPGSWSVTLSRGLARRDPRVVRVTVAVGSATRAR